MQGGDQSATMIEQVQDTFSHIYISDPSSASSNSPFSSNYEYQPPPIPTFEPPQPSFQSSESVITPQPSVPQFHWTSVAIERYPPENLSRPPPPPPSTCESFSEPQTISSHQSQSDHHHHSPEVSHEGEGHFVHKQKSDFEPELEDKNKSESEQSSVSLEKVF